MDQDTIRSRAFFYYIDKVCTDQLNCWLLAEKVQAILDLHGDKIKVTEKQQCVACMGGAIYCIGGTILCDTCLLSHIEHKSNTAWNDIAPQMSRSITDMSAAMSVSTKWTRSKWTGVPMSESFIESYELLKKVMNTAEFAWETTDNTKTETIYFYHNGLLTAPVKESVTQAFRSFIDSPEFYTSTVFEYLTALDYFIRPESYVRKNILEPAQAYFAQSYFKRDDSKARRIEQQYAQYKDYAMRHSNDNPKCFEFVAGRRRF